MYMHLVVLSRWRKPPTKICEGAAFTAAGSSCPKHGFGGNNRRRRLRREWVAGSDIDFHVPFPSPFLPFYDKVDADEGFACGFGINTHPARPRLAGWLPDWLPLSTRPRPHQSGFLFLVSPGIGTGLGQTSGAILRPTKRVCPFVLASCSVCWNKEIYIKVGVKLTCEIRSFYERNLRSLCNVSWALMSAEFQRGSGCES